MNCYHFSYRKYSECVKSQLSMLSQPCKTSFLSLIIGGAVEPQQPETMVWGHSAEYLGRLSDLGCHQAT